MITGKNLKYYINIILTYDEKIRMGEETDQTRRKPRYIAPSGNYQEEES